MIKDRNKLCISICFFYFFTKKWCKTLAFWKDFVYNGIW